MVWEISIGLPGNPPDRVPGGGGQVSCIPRMARLHGPFRDHFTPIQPEMTIICTSEVPS